MYSFTVSLFHHDLVDAKSLESRSERVTAGSFLVLVLEEILYIIVLRKGSLTSVKYKRS